MNRYDDQCSLTVFHARDRLDHVRGQRLASSRRSDLIDRRKSSRKKQRRGFTFFFKSFSILRHCARSEQAVQAVAGPQS